MPAKLKATQGPDEGDEYWLTDQIIFNIGSDEGATICLGDPEISPNHCRLYREEGKYTLFDVSGKGLTVNGKRVVKAELTAGDTIGLGSSELVFSMEDQPAASGASGPQAGGGGSAPEAAPPPARPEPARPEPAPKPKPKPKPGPQPPGPSPAPPQPKPPEPEPEEPPSRPRPAPRPQAEPEDASGAPTGPSDAGGAPGGPGAGADQATAAGGGVPARPPDFEMELEADEGGEIGSAWLTVVEGNDKGKSFDLTDGETWILGRGHSADITVMDIKVSRAHTRIDREDGQYVVIDLNSTNGTFLNGRKIDRQPLHKGDYIKIGYTILNFQVETAGAGDEPSREPAGSGAARDPGSADAGGPAPGGSTDDDLFDDLTFEEGPPSSSSSEPPSRTAATMGPSDAGPGSPGPAPGPGGSPPAGFEEFGELDDDFGGPPSGGPAAPAAPGDGGSQTPPPGGPAPPPPEGPAQQGPGGPPQQSPGGPPQQGPGGPPQQGPGGASPQGPGGAPGQAPGGSAGGGDDDLDGLFDDLFDELDSPPSGGTSSPDPTPPPVDEPTAPPAQGSGSEPWKKKWDTKDLLVPDLMGDEGSDQGGGAPGSAQQPPPAAPAGGGPAADPSGEDDEWEEIDLGGPEPAASPPPEAGGGSGDQAGPPADEEDDLDLLFESGPVDDPLGEEPRSSSGDAFGAVSDVEIDELDLGGPSDEPAPPSGGPEPEPPAPPPDESDGEQGSSAEARKRRPKNFQTMEAPVADFLLKGSGSGRTVECYMCHENFPEEDVKSGKVKLIKDKHYCKDCIEGV